MLNGSFSFYCNFCNVVYNATWGGVGCNECVVFITAEETYMRPKYTNPIFIKGIDSPLSVIAYSLNERYGLIQKGNSVNELKSY